MRVMKSLLLGAAAGLAATAGVQAADLPVKAKPVEYVKICSAYGAGFYYIPGTDICLRVGGYVYYEFGAKGTNAAANIYGTNAGVSASTGDTAPHSGAVTAINAGNNYYNSRTSAKVILDARQNTAYGTLRATFSLGPTNANHSTGAGLDYAYIQFAGFTWGYTNSFFSMGGAYSVVATPTLDWSWLNVFAYTAQLGNGVTASLSFEDPSGRRAALLSSNDTTGAGTTTPVGINRYGGRWMPDVVANINVTQAWGRAQIMGALHQVKPNSTIVGAGGESELGWAVGAGIEVKTPQTGNANNSFLLQGTWTEGAVDYTGFNSAPTAANHVMSLRNMTNAAGPLYTVHDAWFNGLTGDVRLTEAWSVYAAYRHYWTPMLRTGFFAGWLNIETGANIAGNANNMGDLEVLQAGISTIWSPVAGLDLSLDVIYTELDQSNAGTVANNGTRDLITVWSRLRRNF